MTYWLALFAWLGCEPAPILPPDPLDIDPSDQGSFGKLPGPRPFQEGDKRLSMSVFYEGEYSDLLEIDDVTISFFIFQNDFTGTLTYDTLADVDRIEGLASDRIIHGAEGWFGGGIVSTEPIDLSAWTHVSASFKSAAPSFESFDILIGGDVEVRVDVSDHGFANDGEWHSLTIPLTEWTDGGVDLSAVLVPFALVGEGGVAGASLLVDDVYLTAETP